MPNGDLKLTESKLKEFEAGLKEAEETDKQVKDLFTKTLNELCPSLHSEETWISFNEQLLLPLIQEMGAKTYELISGTGHKVESTSSFETFMQLYSSELREPLRTVAVSFLNPKQSSVRSYVLRNLNAYFFLEASNLNEQAITSLLNMTEEKHELKLFLDTNIVFSILGFHNNPSNEAVQSLLKVVEQISGKVSPSFYILPVTADETKNSLNIRKLELAKVKFPANVASVAVELEELSGASKRYVEASLNSARQLSPEEYFGPYLNNLTRILKGHGVELFNDGKVGSYTTKPAVVEDINNLLSYEQSKRGGKAKSYEKVSHDMVLWHFIKDMRPSHLEAPFEAVEWVVTIDYRLLAFDMYKQNHRLPVCIHPAALIQMLQFWVPRTVDFEQAIVRSLQLPLLFQEFDADAERVTISILEKLSKYEGIEHLPRESIGHIIVNEALRQKMRVEEDEQKQIELIRDAIVKENISLNEQLSAANRATNQLKSAIEEQVSLSSQKQMEISRLEQRIGFIEDQVIEQKRNTEVQNTRVANALNQWKIAQNAKAEKQTRTVFNLFTVAITLVLLSAFFILLKPVFDNWSWLEPYAWLASTLLALLLVAIGVKVDPFSWRSWLGNKIQGFLYKRRLSALEEFEMSLRAELPQTKDSNYSNNTFG